MKIIIPIMFLLAASFQANAQSKSSKERLGDKYAFSYSYDKAISAYSNTKYLTIAGSRNLAMSYHKMNKDLQADSVYNTYINSSNEIIPEDFYNYAQVLKNNGKQSQSILWMDKFAAVKPNDLRAIDYNTNKQQYAIWLIDNKVFKVTPQNTNTNAEDFGPAYYKDKIVFASSRADGKAFPKEDNWHKQPYLDMYVADVNQGQLTNPTNFSAELNGKMHDGPASFSKDGKTIAFTRNNYDDKSKDRVVELQLFFSTNTDGKWSEPEAFAYNNTAYSVGHPSLSANGNTLYFASNMPGGFGKADIYRTSKTSSGAWSKPENLGNKINTEGDEIFPFFEENSNMLFFASDGRYGLGGLDVFMSQLNGAEVGYPINPGVPLNSIDDDFSAIVNDKMTKGYFASNRSSGKGSDDIYSFEMPNNLKNKSIKGVAMQKNGSPINNVVVTLFDATDKRIDSFLTNEKGTYAFKVEADKNYSLVGKNSNYLDGKAIASTSTIDSVIIANITLLKPPIAEQIKPKANLTQILELNEIYFDLNKSDIREDAKIELDKIVSIMNEYPNMVVKLSSYTDCRATQRYNLILSNQRAAATLKYIKKRIAKPMRISGRGYGETQLSTTCPCENDNVTNCTDNEYQVQRNTEFLIVESK